MSNLRNIFSTGLILAVAVLSEGCLKLSSSDPYSGDVHTLGVTAVYPEGYDGFVRADVGIGVENMSSGVSYTALTDASGSAKITVPNGLYRVTVSDRLDNDIFNGSAENIVIGGGDANVNVSLSHSKGGTLVIKEIYCGGCSKYPEEGTYQSDQYIIVHNNDNRVLYLDSLCLGIGAPYNSNSTNPWTTNDKTTGETVYQSFVPLVQVLWEIGGNGTSFPLESGKDAVICLRGAIDHTVKYKYSVNLNKPDYFVCYNSTYFSNTTYHPVPGDQIKQDHYLEVVKKFGPGTAYTVSVSSPAVVIFKAQGESVQDFAASDANIIPTPGSPSSYVAAVPWEWIIDGIEVFNGGSSSNSKRISPAVDAGYVSLSDIYQGHTLIRYVDEEATAKSGYEVLKDSNNSSNDCYERKTQSLRDE